MTYTERKKKCCYKVWEPGKKGEIGEYMCLHPDYQTGRKEEPRQIGIRYAPCYSRKCPIEFENAKLESVIAVCETQHTEDVGKIVKQAKAMRVLANSSCCCECPDIRKPECENVYPTEKDEDCIECWIAYAMSEAEK